MCRGGKRFKTIGIITVVIVDDEKTSGIIRSKNNNNNIFYTRNTFIDKFIFIYFII